MAKNKFESLIEHILNDDENAARELFHDIVVEKSREIYNNIVAEEEEREVDESDIDPMDSDLMQSILKTNKAIGLEGPSSSLRPSRDLTPGEMSKIKSGMSRQLGLGEAGMEDQSDDLEQDIESDQFGMDAGDDMEDMEDMGDDMEDMGDDMGDDMGADEGDEEIEDRVVDLESALDDLKAEFDKLMADEAGEEEHMDGDMNDYGNTEEDEEEGEDEEDENKLPEGMVREYVEKVPAPAKSEQATNTKSPVAGSNNMGGTASNIARGGSNANPTGPAKPNNAYTKGQGDLGAVDPRVAAKSAFGKKAPAPVTGESNANTRSPLAK